MTTIIIDNNLLWHVLSDWQRTLYISQVLYFGSSNLLSSTLYHQI